MTAPILELDDVSAAYSTYRALFGVSFSVPDGGLVALIGSNGAGKSTVARVVTGLVPASGGRVRIGGEDVTKMSAHRIARLGVAHVPEGRALFSTLTVEENLLVSFRRKVGRQGSAEALERAYGAFGVLKERRKQLGGTLSGGQQRILSLARVLAVPARLLIVDELSLGLAPVIVDQVYDGLAAIHREGTAVLVVEQQVDRALSIAQEAVFLMKGAVAWHGPASGAKPAMESMLLGGASPNGATASPPAPSNMDRAKPTPPSVDVARPAAPSGDSMSKLWIIGPPGAAAGPAPGST